MARMTRTSRFTSAVLAALLAARAAAAAPAAPALKIFGAPDGRASLSASDFAALPRLKVDAVDHDGRKAAFEGWALGDVLALTGLPRGKDLRGAALAVSVLAAAADGYRVVFALSELDPSVTDKVVLLADRRDGAPLGPAEGPWRVVVPSEKRPARWIRQVVSFAIQDPREDAKRR
jgi:hypothetical protein